MFKILCRDGICWWIAHYKVCEVQCEDNLDNLTENRFVICKLDISYSDICWILNAAARGVRWCWEYEVWMLGRLTLVVTRCNMRRRRRVVMVSEWSTELWWHGVLLSLCSVPLPGHCSQFSHSQVIPSELSTLNIVKYSAIMWSSPPEFICCCWMNLIINIWWRV